VIVVVVAVVAKVTNRKKNSLSSRSIIRKLSKNRDRKRTNK